jgi:hypothetical protein
VIKIRKNNKEKVIQNLLLNSFCFKLELEALRWKLSHTLGKNGEKISLSLSLSLLISLSLFDHIDFLFVLRHELPQGTHRLSCLNLHPPLTIPTQTLAFPILLQPWKA